MEFKESQTRENLMRAFAGESQARNRYTFSASVARSAGLHGVERVFRFTAEQEAQLLQAKADSPDEVLLIAEVDGAIAGTAGVDALGRRDKVRHRATFGISLDQAYWGLGIGTALTAACIECARQAGYEQLELEVVEDNVRAISLYRRAGFVEYGCNPLGLRPRTGGYQALLAMRLELSGPSPLPPPNH